VKVVLSKDEIKMAITKYVETKTGKKTSGSPVLRDAGGIINKWIEAEIYIKCD